MNRRRRSSCSFAILLAAGALAGVGGCDQGDDIQASLSRAEHKLTSISAGRGAVPSPEHAQSVYQEVRQELAPVLDRGLPAEQAAAHVLIAEAELSQAVGPARRLIELEREGLDRLQEIGAVVSLWTEANREAEVASGHDVNEQRQKLQSRLDEVAGEAESRQGERANLQAQRDELASQMEAALQEATGEQERSAQLQMEADATDDAGEALEIVRRVQEHRRRADAATMEAENLRIELDTLDPQLERQAMELDRLARQREAIEAALARLDEGERQARERARRAREQAESFGGELRELVLGEDGYVAFRQGPLGEALEATVGAYEQAEATARRASGELRQNAQLVVARAQQGVGRAHLEHASGGEVALEVLGPLRDVPAVRGERLGSALEQLASEVEASKQAAGEAYQAALDAYSSAGLRGEAAERLANLESSIGRLADRLGDSGPDGNGGEG